MKISQLVVTPRIAKSWLKSNPHNRRISEGIVLRYANDMKNGYWQENGESIKFNGGGELIDGQHRLMAIIKSDKPQKCIIVRGLNKNVFTVLDSGKKRNFSDTLTVAGINTYVMGLAALTKLFYDYGEHGLENMWSGKRADKHGSQAVNNDILLAYYKNNPQILESFSEVNHINTEKSGRLLPLVMLSFMYFIFSQKNKDQAKEFISRLIMGEGLTKDNPIYKLREYLTHLKFKNLPIQRKQSCLLLIKAWNAYRRGDSPRSFNMTKDSKIPTVI